MRLSSPTKFRSAFVSTALPIATLLLLACNASAQEHAFFSNVVQSPSGSIGWDSFTVTDPNNYVGPHAADVVELGASNSVVSVTPGGFKAGPNLYAFFSTPTWSVDLNGLTTTEQFTSVGLQIATTPPPMGMDIDQDSFLLNGISSDEFISLGTRTQLVAGGGQPAQDVNYYWAAWNGLDALSSYSIEIGPGQNHAVFAAAHVDYINTASRSSITVVPEPGTAGLVALGSCLALIRRKQR